jgi:hypothetical protein
MTATYDEDRDRFVDENGVSWRSGESLPEDASDALRVVAYRSAAWVNASTYPWKPTLWQSWMQRADALAPPVRPFSNGTSRMLWMDGNCDRCVKAISADAFADGKPFPCPEFTDQRAPSVRRVRQIEGQEALL